jgi:hypothetical protein
MPPIHEFTPFRSRFAPGEVHLYRIEASLAYIGQYDAPRTAHSVSLRDHTLVYAWLDEQSRCFLKIVDLYDNPADQSPRERIVHLEINIEVGFTTCIQYHLR